MKGRGGAGFAKLAFAVGVLLLTGGFGLALGLYSGAKRNELYKLANTGYETVKQVFREAPDQLLSSRPGQFLRPSRKPGADVTVNAAGEDGQLVLMTSFFDGQTGMRLMRRDGTVVAKWPVSHSEHFPDTSFLGDTAPQTDLNVDLHGVVIHPDGSIVFNYEYAGTVKLSRCGEVIWTLPHATHHSLEFAEGGGYWIPGRRMVTPGNGDPDLAFPPFTLMEGAEHFGDDLILRVSEDGRIEEQRSVMRIFYDNGLEPLMTATGGPFLRDGEWHTDLVHLNKIAELPASMAAAFPEFEAGDLMISLRRRNLVAVVDPDTWKVRWHQTGPWRRQHDPEFLSDGTIAVFNNNTYRTSLLSFNRFDPEAPFVSNVLTFDPATGTHRVVYGERPGEEFLSVIRGKIDPTRDGGYLITEFAAGRAFEIDDDGKVVWEYINRYDDDHVIKITEARLYPEDYFTVSDWSCPAQ